MAKVEKRSTQASIKEPPNEPIQDLRDWLERVDELGELIRIKEALDPIEQMSAIGYLVAKQNPSPAILMEKTKGYEKSPIQARHLWNILGPSFKRIALTLEEPPDTPTLELIRRVKDKLKRRIPPKEVAKSAAGFYQNSQTGDQVNLEALDRKSTRLN